MPASTALPDDASLPCPRCECFLADFGGTARTVSCPGCNRRIADASEAIARMSTPARLIEIFPESVARENGIMAFSADDSRLVVLSDVAAWNVAETVTKLRFILGVVVDCVHADTEVIRRAIDRDYGLPHADDDLPQDPGPLH